MLFYFFFFVESVDDSDDFLFTGWHVKKIGERHDSHGNNEDTPNTNEEGYYTSRNGFGWVIAITDFKYEVKKQGEWGRRMEKEEREWMKVGEERKKRARGRGEIYLWWWWVWLPIDCYSNSSCLRLYRPSIARKFLMRGRNRKDWILRGYWRPWLGYY